MENPIACRFSHFWEIQMSTYLSDFTFCGFLFFPAEIRFVPLKMVSCYHYRRFPRSCSWKATSSRREMFSNLRQIIFPHQRWLGNCFNTPPSHFTHSVEFAFATGSNNTTWKTPFSLYSLISGWRVRFFSCFWRRRSRWTVVTCYSESNYKFLSKEMRILRSFVGLYVWESLEKCFSVLWRFL